MPHEEIAAEDYNCNIRRYVDNAPPPEPQDVRAHLHGGVPLAEVENLQHCWSNYPQLRDDCFKPRDESYLDLAPVIADKRDIAELVNTHQSIIDKHSAIMEKIENWWQKNLPIVEALAPDPAFDKEQQNEESGNVYIMRSALPCQTQSPRRTPHLPSQQDAVQRYAQWDW